MLERCFVSQLLPPAHLRNGFDEINTSSLAFNIRGILNNVKIYKIYAIFKKLLRVVVFNLLHMKNDIQWLTYWRIIIISIHNISHIGPPFFNDFIFSEIL